MFLPYSLAIPCCGLSKQPCFPLSSAAAAARLLYMLPRDAAAALLLSLPRCPLPLFFNARTAKLESVTTPLVSLPTAAFEQERHRTVKPAAFAPAVS